MEQIQQKKAVLILEDGTEFTGRAMGAQGEAIGQVVFNTSAGGFLEGITDPSAWGQILVQTFPLAGGYGVNRQDAESQESTAAGYIVREVCGEPSNFRSQGTLEGFLCEKGVPGLADIDTRALTRHLRKNGCMNGLITTDLETDRAGAIRRLKAHRLTGAVERLSVKAPVVCGEEDSPFAVTVYDLGCKRSVIQALVEKGCRVTLTPWNTPLAQVLAQKPQGVVLAGGPGSPEDYAGLAQGFAPLLRGGTPVLGLGLGHQLLAMAAGARMIPLKHGHRGASQPVKDLRTGRTFVTSQNHGWAVEPEEHSAEYQVLCENINDHTCEGLVYQNAPALSIQFHPVAFTGTEDTSYYLGLFAQMMQNKKGESQCR